MFKLIRKKLIEGFIKDIIKDLPKYKKNALIYFQAHKEEIIKKVIDFIKKEITAVLTLFLLCVVPVLADDNANQEIVIEANKAVVTVQKQPTDKKSVQKQDVKRNWFCIIIQVNGKLQDFTPTDNVKK